MSSFKKIPIALAVLVATGTAAWAIYYVLAQAPMPLMQPDNKTVSLQVGTTTVVAEVADTPALRAQGLSNRASLEEGQGMWFVFEEDGLWSFWMKDTLIPLDIIWVSATGTVVHIAHTVQPDSYPQGFAPSSPARYVLEVPSGWARKMGIIEGMVVQQK